MTKIQQIIGERIRNFRKQKGWSQEELADIANLHATYIGQLERGEKNATLESINKIATALEVSLEELFKSIQPNSKKPDYTLSQIITKLQARPVEDQKFILNMLDLLLNWKDK
ncbi:MAG: XRE family transcriptional regulator [Bacillaceae bacterium]|jgi:Predicted transcription factor, homolog of eukaryotic MBF1|uniref:Transcriptional regulator n=2 Tax=Aeribacillus TaxID=1055323 RepID=A0A165XZ04_9BACI|nr:MULTISPECIES: helix-turn-helix transcriptional regulator [Aeribacillus]AXI38806.1 XRE family transcriptional regulator [Bacillaceae bacterium ZC4]REJ19699.1 MAG: XRE family transcriptional regulator [Bacillaceae bacterium]AXI38874.1 XRE family transcriptional regulator [Bacillaceae bacterium ZC4]KZM53110.1 transcriptional regulator [Aeribacillus pallidus]KZN96550.1 transcriptional regulator [Aeribacillus pallidus]